MEKFNLTYTNGVFDFKFLPSVINDIINKDVEEMTREENIKIHKTHYNKTLDIIKNLKKIYDICPTSEYGYLNYRLDIPLEDEIEIMGDVNIIFSFSVDTENERFNLNECIDFSEHNFYSDDEGYIESYSDDDINME